jgi:hypothetical protein
MTTALPAAPLVAANTAPVPNPQFQLGPASAETAVANAAVSPTKGDHVRSEHRRTLPTTFTFGQAINKVE